MKADSIPSGPFEGGIRPPKRSRGRRCCPLQALGGTLSVLAVLAAFAWANKLGSATPVPAKSDVAVAVDAATVGLLTNAACPKEPAAIKEAAANLSVILHPELVQREARKDPAFLKAETAAAASFLNPGAAHAQRMQNPAYRQNYSAAMTLFKEQAQRTALPIVLSATDAKQLDAILNNPAWRKQREESLRAAMPPGQVRPVLNP